MQMEKMEKSFEAVKRSFSTVRTGRANPGMLDRIEVRITLPKSKGLRIPASTSLLPGRSSASTAWTSARLDAGWLVTLCDGVIEKNR